MGRRAQIVRLRWEDCDLKLGAIEWGVEWEDRIALLLPDSPELVIALWGGALHKLLAEDRPVVPRPDPSIADQAAAAGDYNTLDPTTTADELAANADRMARKVAIISADQWERVIVLGDEEMTAIAVVRKVAHEGAHHLLDIGRSLRAVRSG